MSKPFTKSILFLLLLCSFAIGRAFGQTITIGAYNKGPYAPGSTTSIPFTVTGCVYPHTTYNLYLSNSTGTFATPKDLIGTFTNFYANYVNGVIPTTGIVSGTGYELEVDAVLNDTLLTSAVSTVPITINASAAGVAAAITSTEICPNNPNVFGTTSGNTGSTVYAFYNTSTAGATVTASFYNELTHASEGTIAPAKGGTNFTANADNYTITVTAVSAGGIVGTESYYLINNVVNTSFDIPGGSTICLGPGGKGSLPYGFDISSAIGIQNNFPGLVYCITWGDGTTDSLTFCNIKADNGLISHPYTYSSCGNIPLNNVDNSFEVSLQLYSPYCGNIGSPLNANAYVFTPPVNDFVLPSNGVVCAGSTVTINNTSDPGQVQGGTGANCRNQNAQYTWQVSGQPPSGIYPLGTPFTYTFTTAGTYVITLRLATHEPSSCAPTDATQTICIQNPPQPKFSLPVITGCPPLSVTPIQQSVIDSNCNNKNTYLWTVTGPASVSYADGTNANSAKPKFGFNNPGIYQVTLGINTLSCGLVTTQPQTIVVDSALAVSLSPDTTLCGSDLALTFGPNQGGTSATITGVTQPVANSYTWTVSGGAYTFEGGTTATSHYPQILFSGFGTYTVSVKVQNSCGSITKSQTISLVNGPAITITPSATNTCPSTAVILKGAIDGSSTGFAWSSSGSGKFSAPNSLTTDYTPSVTDNAAGNVAITLTAKTSLAAPCSLVSQIVTIGIYPPNTITGASTNQICSGSALDYAIVSTVPGSTFTWTASLVTGKVTGFSSVGGGSDINDLLTNPGATNAAVKYIITPSANGCIGTPFTLLVTVLPLPVITATPAAQTICNGSAASINLKSNMPGTTYTWTTTSTPANVVAGNLPQSTPVTASAISNILSTVSYTSNATVTYIITPYNDSCAGVPVTATVIIPPLPVVSNPGNNDEVCNATTYTLNGNNPSPGTGKWTVSVSPATTPAPSFDDDTNPASTVSGLKAGAIYTFTWTITSGALCNPSANTVTIIDDLPSAGGTTAGGATVCTGSNSGTITLSGQLGNIIGWESTNATAVNWQPTATPPNTTASQSYFSLTQTTLYRAVVQNGVCGIAYSTVTTIVVSQPAIQAVAGPSQTLCGATTTVLTGNNPSPFTGGWTQKAGPPANIAPLTNASAAVSNLKPGNVYTFQWTINGQPPCANSSDTTQIVDENDVIAGFTVDKADGCGVYTVNFTNTSTVLTGTSFMWDFGDPSATPANPNTSTLVNPSHTFLPTTDGKDTTYIVALSIVGNCKQRPADTLAITVRTQTPVVQIVPQQVAGCSPFTLVVNNYSPGNNESYVYYLQNANGQNAINPIHTTNKNAVSLGPITINTTQQFTLYAVATDTCGNTGESNLIPITISVPNLIAQMAIANGVSAGCVPLTVNFLNNSVGGGTFLYKIYDATQTNLIDTRTGGPGLTPYTFNSPLTPPGTYYVTVTATNNCTSAESSPKVRVDVYPVPLPQFAANDTSGCRSVTVSFTNNTPNDPSIQATSLNYAWSFGDGSPDEDIFTPAPHVYSSKSSPYTVTLTATNPVTNCTNVITKTAYINVTAPPGTLFTEKPEGITSIPNYTFSFIDQTTGNPVSWYWQFGDGTSDSTSRNPQHTYSDTGRYAVSLTTGTASGCDSTVTDTVRITGIPGQLFLPNAFQPDGGSTAVRVFMAKGSGIKTWRMQIFNNFSQLVWETTELDANGSPVAGCLCLAGIGQFY
jgi:PKD repeat protein